MVRVEPDEATALGEGEAYLILHVDTDVDLESVSLRAGRIADDLPKGEHIWIVRTRARKGAWARVDFGSEFGRRAYVDMARWHSAREGEFLFEIEAGRINYPGTLIVRSEILPGLKAGGRWVSVRNRNHSAKVVRLLLESHRDLIESLPLHYAGSSGDGFLEYYSEARHRVGASEASPIE